MARTDPKGDQPFVDLDGFAARLRHARLNAGMSQRDLERSSGIPKSRISRYENGHLLPSLVGLRRLSTSLSISDGLLLGETDPYGAFVDILIERGVSFRSPRDAQRAAHRYADALERGRPEARRS